MTDSESIAHFIHPPSIEDCRHVLHSPDFRAHQHSFAPVLTDARQGHNYLAVAVPTEGEILGLKCNSVEVHQLIGNIDIYLWKAG